MGIAWRLILWSWKETIVWEFFGSCTGTHHEQKVKFQKSLIKYSLLGNWWNFFFRATVPVEKCIQPKVLSSPHLLFRIFTTVIFLTLTHPSRHKIFPEHPEKDAWVEIWHHHLEKVRIKLSENSKMFLIGQWEKELSRQMVKMPRTFQNHQSIAGSSKFFNLNPNAGTKTNFSTSTQKSERFLARKWQHREHQRSSQLWRNKTKRYTGNASQSISFQKWEISLVHYKRGYSGPGMLGE